MSPTRRVSGREYELRVRAIKRYSPVCVAACWILVLVACDGGFEEAVSTAAPPVAAGTSDVSQGEAPLTVHMDASESDDPQKFPLVYAWTFSDGTTSTGVAVAHTFQDHGNYSATVTVNDGHHTTTSTPIRIRVTPAPPFVAPTAVSMNLIGISPSSASGIVKATDREELVLTYSLASQPAVGAVKVDASSGAFVYTLPQSTTATSDSFTVKVSNIGGSAIGSVTVALHGNPLVVSQ
jgi:PKD repeat protein